MTTSELLRAQWRRLGFRFAISACAQPIDIEKLIFDSATHGREDPDLYWAALAWLIRFSDIVNIPRLSRYFDENKSALLGLLADIALTEGGEKRLGSIKATSRPLLKPEILFTVMTTQEFLIKKETEQSLPIALKWGFLCSGITIKTDALCQRSYVLEQNPIAALRALFGPHARADIIHSLLITSEQTIAQLARRIGMSYQPVHAEIEHLKKNGFVKCTTWGKSCVVTLVPESKKFFKSIPAALAIS